MHLHPIRLGDGKRTATGWLVVSHGAVRAILTPLDGEVLLGFACDRRIRPLDGCLRFCGFQEARSWLERRLETGPSDDGDSRTPT